MPEIHGTIDPERLRTELPKGWDVEPASAGGVQVFTVGKAPGGRPDFELMPCGELWRAVRLGARDEGYREDSVLGLPERVVAWLTTFD